MKPFWFVLTVTLILASFSAAKPNKQGERQPPRGGVDRSLSNEPPLHTGLPDTAPATLPEDFGYVRFEGIAGHLAPIGSGRLIVTGATTNRDDIFAEEFWAMIPERTHILHSRDAQNREVWNYPVATTVVHRILFRTHPPTPFELRIEKKLPDGKWAYGVYLPIGQDPKKFVLHKEWIRDMSFDVRVPAGDVHIEGRRIHPESCRSCHFMRTATPYQYPSRDYAGPCGFVPGNPAVLGRWAGDFERMHGYFPFKQEATE